ncbi:glutathione S-transferase family protein, partial [Paraburkholderia sp. SIMBA_030]|uniref:glutathione S-transferase family protein n=1 Tax=Paraburkholderia sp. SIMBA_030 TaxID=3085773 RepID=UPI0039784244
DIFKGEQHAPAFLKINPNAKVPALVDDGVTVFDSHAILLYLAEKHGRFIPAGIGGKAAMLSWLQLVATGLSRSTSCTTRRKICPMRRTA